NYQPLYDPPVIGTGAIVSGPQLQNTGPLPVVVEQGFSLTAGGVMRLDFDAEEWNSVISFQNGIQVALGGTLDLEFTSDVDVARQVGRKIHVFDWGGVSPNGSFAIGGPYTWDVSQLYTSGDVTLTAVPEPSGCLLGTIVCGWFVGFERRTRR